MCFRKRLEDRFEMFDSKYFSMQDVKALLKEILCNVHTVVALALRYMDKSNLQSPSGFHNNFEQICNDQSAICLVSIFGNSFLVSGYSDSYGLL